MKIFKENIKINISGLGKGEREDLLRDLYPLFSIKPSWEFLIQAHYIYIYPHEGKLGYTIMDSVDYFEDHCNKSVSIEELISMLKGGFTKSDLVVGKHVIEVEDGQKYLLVHTDISGVSGINLSGDSHYANILSNFNEDLSSKLKFYNNPIVKVYTLGYSNAFNLLDTNLALSWERETKTQAQIQYEECEKKMKELQEEMGKLKQQM